MPSSEENVRLYGVPFLDEREPQLPVERTPRWNYADKVTVLSNWVTVYSRENSPGCERFSSALGDGVLRKVRRTPFPFYFTFLSLFLRSFSLSSPFPILAFSSPLGRSA